MSELKDFFGSAGGGGSSAPWLVITGDTAAVVGEAYAVDTTLAIVNLTLPAAPVVNDEIPIVDYLGNFATFMLNVVHNGNPIMGLLEDMECDLDHQSATLVYVDAVQGWVVTDGK